MKVYGSSVLKGLLYTLKTFVSTYVEDFRRKGASGSGPLRSPADGIVTVQYPEAPLPIGATYERFRVLPMLIYDQQDNGEKDIRCTSCGICAKVCPPQCIWIVQETDENKKPVPRPEAFYIDTSVCMNCGLCSEFCPFDAIKMDHKFDLNTTSNRQQSYLYDMERLLVPAEYYAELHPKANAAEEEARRLEAEAKAKKEAAKKETAAKKAAEAKAAKAAEAEGSAEAAPAPASAPQAAAAKADDPERAARIAAAKAKAAEAKAKREADKAAGGGDAEAAAADTDAKAAKADDPERAARIAAAKAKAAEAKAKREAEKAAAENEPSPKASDEA